MSKYNKSSYVWWDFTNDVGEHKKNILRQDELAHKDYLPFMVNRGLSKHVDCVMYVNELNIRPEINKQMQYDYLVYSLRQKKRWGEKTEKPDKIDNLDLIKEHYGYSNEKAKEALKLLSDKAINDLKVKYNKGGTSK